MNGNGDVCAIIKVVSGPAKLPIPFVIMKAVSSLAVIISALARALFFKTTDALQKGWHKHKHTDLGGQLGAPALGGVPHGSQAAPGQHRI